MLVKKLEKFMGVYVDEEKIHAFHMQALKEKKKLKELHLEIIEDYLKKHGDGNPQFTLEQFEDPDFIACPAFYRNGDTWLTYLSKQQPQELQKVRSQILLIEKQMMKFI